MFANFIKCLRAVVSILYSVLAGALSKINLIKVIILKEALPPPPPFGVIVLVIPNIYLCQGGGEGLEKLYRHDHAPRAAPALSTLCAQT